MSDDNISDLFGTKLKLNLSMKNEEIFLEQRVHVNWLN